MAFGIGKNSPTQVCSGILQLMQNNNFYFVVGMFGKGDRLKIKNNAKNIFIAKLDQNKKYHEELKIK